MIVEKRSTRPRTRLAVPGQGASAAPAHLRYYASKSVWPGPAGPRAGAAERGAMPLGGSGSRGRGAGGSRPLLSTRTMSGAELPRSGGGGGCRSDPALSSSSRLRGGPGCSAPTAPSRAGPGWAPRGRQLRDGGAQVRRERPLRSGSPRREQAARAGARGAPAPGEGLSRAPAASPRWSPAPCRRSWLRAAGGGSEGWLLCWEKARGTGIDTAVRWAPGWDALGPAHPGPGGPPGPF